MPTRAGVGSPGFGLDVGDGAGRAIVFAIGLHPHLISVPHRIHELENMLDTLTGCLDVGLYTGSQLTDMFFEALPSPSNL